MNFVPMPIRVFHWEWRNLRITLSLRSHWRIWVKLTSGHSAIWYFLFALHLQTYRRFHHRLFYTGEVSVWKSQLWRVHLTMKHISSIREWSASASHKTNCPNNNDERSGDILTSGQSVTSWHHQFTQSTACDNFIHIWYRLLLTLLQFFMVTWPVI